MVCSLQTQQRMAALWMEILARRRAGVSNRGMKLYFTLQYECFELVTDCSHLVAKVLSECTGGTHRRREVHAAILLYSYCVLYPYDGYRTELLCSLPRLQAATPPGTPPQHSHTNHAPPTGSTAKSRNIRRCSALHPKRAPTQSNGRRQGTAHTA